MAEDMVLGDLAARPRLSWIIEVYTSTRVGGGGGGGGDHLVIITTFILPFLQS